MAEAATSTQLRTHAAAVPPFLAADVGGTHARIGLVQSRGWGQPVEVLQYQRYACAEWPSLTALLADFLQQLGPGAAVTHCAVASAGYVLDDAVINDTLPWKVSIGDIRRQLGIAQLAMINDFEAVAYATQFLREEDTVSVIEGGATRCADRASSPVLVMGPGTGLGSAVLLPGQPHASVLPTEAGQIALAPGNPREMDILTLLARDRPHVAYEHALSGPGLSNLYRAICTLRDRSPTLAQPEEISRAAVARSDDVAVEALEVFCALLGSFAGDLAMLYGASGGVYLAGGILPQIRPVLLASTFAERFFNKGVMRPFLQQVPVRLMEHGQHGVIGAAGLFLDGHAAHVGAAQSVNA